MNLLGTPTEQDVKEMCASVQVNLPTIKGCGFKKKLS